MSVGKKGLVNLGWQNFLFCVTFINRGGIQTQDYLMRLSQHYKWILMFLFVGGKRQRYNEPVIGKTRLVKELFLLREVGKIKEMYEFQSDKYGPSSNEIIKDLDILLQDGFIKQHSHPYGTLYQLTPLGIKKAQEQLNDDLKYKIENIKRNYNDVPLNELLVYVYSAFPKYTTKSVIKEKLEDVI